MRGLFLVRNEQRVRRIRDAILSETGSGIRTIQELLGHRDVKTTIIHTHKSCIEGRPVSAVRLPVRRTQTGWMGYEPIRERPRGKGSWFGTRSASRTNGCTGQALHNCWSLRTCR